jgi:hypothetical protein
MMKCASLHRNRNSDLCARFFRSNGQPLPLEVFRYRDLASTAPLERTHIQLERSTSISYERIGDVLAAAD